jgi:hypothetical protein
VYSIAGFKDLKSAGFFALFEKEESQEEMGSGIIWMGMADCLYL